MIFESHLDTDATAETVRRKLMKSHEKMVEMECNVEQYNTYIDTLCERLHQKNATTSDLTTYLFCAYERVSDKNFVRYITNLKDLHQDGTKTLSAETLMDLALKRYNLLREADAWNAPEESEEKIMALEADLKETRKDLKNMKKAYAASNKAKKPTPTKNGKPESKPTWLRENTPPKKSQAKEKRTWGTMSYYWCDTSTRGKCGGKWRAHKPTECKGKDFMCKAKGSHGDNKRLKLDKALETIMQSGNSNSE